MNTMEEAASQLERDHVHSVYDKIAPYFNDNRYKAWPKVREFLLDLSPGSIVADIGCGNGKYLSINKEVFKLGCDVCRPLVDFAWSQGHEVQMCDGLHLPYRDGCFDAVLSIAVIHHLSTKERRIRAIREMARTLRVGGCIMIYVWAMEQKRRKFEKQDIFIPWNPNPHVPSHSNKDDGKPRRATAQSVSDAADNSKKHRKVRSTSSVADQGHLTPSAPQQKTQRLWFFSRSLDSVFDFGSLAISWPSSKDLSTLSSPTSVNEGREVKQRGRGRRLIKQVSSFFSPPSTIGSEEDVFDLGQNDAEDKSPDPYSSTENQSISGSLVQECGSLALPDLISLQEHPKQSAGENNQELQESTSPPGSGRQEESSCLRYYHVFREGELAELIENNVEELRVKHSYFDHANWCVVAEKVELLKI
uniref:tRNA methyltransferase 9B n=1 Tax=Oryzias latipes TaxID=8090 RepID=A0A3P9I7G1_ORYLA